MAKRIFRILSLFFKLTILKITILIVSYLLLYDISNYSFSTLRKESWQHAWMDRLAVCWFPYRNFWRLQIEIREAVEDILDSFAVLNNIRGSVATKANRRCWGSPKSKWWSLIFYELISQILSWRRCTVFSGEATATQKCVCMNYTLGTQHYQPKTDVVHMWNHLLFFRHVIASRKHYYAWKSSCNPNRTPKQRSWIWIIWNWRQ